MSQQLGIDQLGIHVTVRPPIEMPRRRKLKTLKKRGTDTPPQSTAQKDVGIPQVDTFARTGIPDVSHTLKYRR